MNYHNTPHWRANVRLILILLSLWFLVSCVCSIFLVDYLNLIRIGGYKLGFWFAQQGSVYSFLLLIFFYGYQMDKIDRKYGVTEENEDVDSMPDELIE